MIFGSDANKGVGDAGGDDDRVLGIEPVMRVGHAVRMAAFIDDALSANLEQRNAGRCIEIGLTPAQQSIVARLIDQGVQPVVVAEADPHQQARAPQFAEIAGTRLECFGIGAGRHDGFDGDEVAADDCNQCGEIGRRRHHAQRSERRRGDQCGRRDDQADQPGPHEPTAALPRCSWAPDSARLSALRLARPDGNPLPCWPARTHRGGSASCRSAAIRSSPRRRRPSPC